MLLSLAVAPALQQSLKRLFHTNSPLKKGNRQRVRLAGPGTAVKSSNSRRDTLLKEKSEILRSKYFERQQRQIDLVGIKPCTNIYFLDDYEKHKYSLIEALSILQTASQPEMFDCLENPLKLKLTTNMKTKKANKFIQKYESLIALPHTLDFLPQRKVVAVCDNLDTVTECSKNGAWHAGMADLLIRLENGSIHWEDYDTVVAHTSHEKGLHKIRNVLKDRIPIRKNGRLGDNVLEMLEKEKTGIYVSSKHVDGIPEINTISVVIGQPNWSLNKLNDNIQTYLNCIQEARSNRVIGDTFIDAYLSVAPFDVSLELDLSLFQISSPIHSNDEISKTDEED